MAAGGGNGNTYPPFPMTATKTTMVAGLTGGAVHRIRSPNEEDVLCGRGGGINSHKGNKAFREWVNQRKEEYNLAENKKGKIAVAMQVVRQVQQQSPVPGRFLQRDSSMIGGNGGQWWVEIDDAKALAKTTQALREGAPKIRQAHQNTESGSHETQKTKKRKRKGDSVAVVIETPTLDDATEKLVLQTVKQDASRLPRYKSEQLLLPTRSYSSALEQLQENVEKAKQEAAKGQGKPMGPPPPMKQLIAPLTSNKAFDAIYSQPKSTVGPKSQFNPLAMPAVDPFAETPPLMAAPEPIYADDIPVLSLDGGKTIRVDDIDNAAVLQASHKKTKLRRVHSLVLSDVDEQSLGPATDELVEFVNPFADETNVMTIENDPKVVESYVPLSVFNQWNKNQAMNIVDGSDHSKPKVLSIGGYLNRLLSFSSSVAPNEPEPISVGENHNSESNNNDYFFDDVTESESGRIMKPFFDVVHPGGKSLENTNSTTSLIRHTSFSSRNRAVASGRQ